MPKQTLFFLVLACLGTLIIVAVQKGLGLSKKYLWRGCFVWGLILFQTFLHLSLRSPYTYVPHYEQPKENNYWYHYYLFPNQQGAVNLDYHDFRAAEELFLGFPKELDVMSHRSFPQYLAHAFTAFLNPYYVYLVMNTLVWLLAVGVVFWWVSSLTDEETGCFSGLLFASSQALILFVAQPMVYVFSTCGVVIILALYRYIQLNPSRHAHWLFGIAGGLFSLCYEAQPFFLSLLVIALFEQKGLRSFVYGLVISQMIYVFFMLLIRKIPGLLYHETLATLGEGHPLSNIQTLIVSQNYVEFFDRAWRVVPGYLDCLLHAFQICFAFGIVGFFFLRTRDVKRLFLLLCLPGFMTYAMFKLGHSFYVQFPRMSYSAYPALYLAAGSGLTHLKNRLGSKWGMVSARVLLVVNFVWLNIDVLGIPRIYFEWWFRFPLYSTVP